VLWQRKNKETDARFLKEVIKFYPYKINYILTNNWFEFSYKALTKNKKKQKRFIPLIISVKKTKSNIGPLNLRHLPGLME
jgi:adenine C2-methylase RlmN of 23S rRNA A2503 and tRNA A37